MAERHDLYTGPGGWDNVDAKSLLHFNPLMAAKDHEVGTYFIITLIPFHAEAKKL